LELIPTNSGSNTKKYKEYELHNLKQVCCTSIFYYKK
jgi:hypothetical protein